MPCTCDHLRSSLSWSYPKYCTVYLFLFSVNCSTSCWVPRYVTAVIDCLDFWNKLLIEQQRKHLLRGAGRQTAALVRCRKIKVWARKRRKWYSHCSKFIMKSSFVQCFLQIEMTHSRGKDRRVWDKIRSSLKDHTHSESTLYFPSSPIIATYAVLQYSLLFNTAVHNHHCCHSICSHCQQSLKCQIKCNEDNEGAWQIFQISFRI